MIKYFFLIIICIYTSSTIYSQDVSPLSGIKLKLNSPTEKNENANSTLPISIAVAGFLYLFNPIVLLENDKIAFGVTKELSLGFGYFGQNRLSFEYSYIFVNSLKSRIYAGYKHDILLKSGIKPSHMLQGSPTVSLGAGYFTNFTNSGYFGESSYGYSIRNDKILIYPNVKLRFTYVPNGSDILDISAGIVIGLANPFINLDIKRKY
ncbi:MAG TPA: hypothetical protein PKC91_05240 [Ignavibacteria bacterium]|nr:hypothetical protein [Ignavibacteria bacterium]